MEHPQRYTLVDNGDGTYTITPAPGTVIEEGTPVNASRMNKIEDQIELLSVQPLYLKSATYDSANDQIDCVFAAGQIELFNGDSRVLVQVNDDATYSINAPAINTTYYIFLQPDGTFTHNTTGNVPAGSVFVWEVATGAAVDEITKTDRRYQISGVGAKLAAHLADYANYQRKVRMGAM